MSLQVIEQMRSKLRINCSPVQIPIGLEHEHVGLVDLLSMKAYHFEGIFGEILKEVSLLAGSQLQDLQEIVLQS